MALPFIVGPHQCSLTQGPDGRPQVEVVLRIRLPLAEFSDALLLTLAEQHPLFPQGGHEPDPASIAPVKVGLQATERRSPPLKEEASPKRKTAGRTQPKKPAHPPTQVTPADPTHEKLLAVLSQAAQLPDTEERGGVIAAADPPPTHSVTQNVRTTRSNQPYMQECKVCVHWYRKLNKLWTTCLTMCRVFLLLPWLTYIPSCVAWFT